MYPPRPMHLPEHCAPLYTGFKKGLISFFFTVQVAWFLIRLNGKGLTRSLQSKWHQNISKVRRDFVIYFVFDSVCGEKYVSQLCCCKNGEPNKDHERHETFLLAIASKEISFPFLAQRKKVEEDYLLCFQKLIQLFCSEKDLCLFPLHIHMFSCFFFFYYLFFKTLEKVPGWTFLGSFVAVLSWLKEKFSSLLCLFFWIVAQN